MRGLEARLALDFASLHPATALAVAASLFRGVEFCFARQPRSLPPAGREHLAGR